MIALQRGNIRPEQGIVANEKGSVEVEGNVGYGDLLKRPRTAGAGRHKFVHFIVDMTRSALAMVWARQCARMLQCTHRAKQLGLVRNLRRTAALQPEFVPE